jgi:hypothetical protein
MIRRQDQQSHPRIAMRLPVTRDRVRERNGPPNNYPLKSPQGTCRSIPGATFAQSFLKYDHYIFACCLKAFIKPAKTIKSWNGTNHLVQLCHR